MDDRASELIEKIQHEVDFCDLKECLNNSGYGVVLANKGAGIYEFLPIVVCSDHRRYLEEMWVKDRTTSLDAIIKNGWLHESMLDAPVLELQFPPIEEIRSYI